MNPVSQRKNGSDGCGRTLQQEGYRVGVDFLNTKCEVAQVRLLGLRALEMGMLQ